MTDLSKCPGCGGPADQGNDRCLPPSPYFCTKCTDKERIMNQNEPRITKKRIRKPSTATALDQCIRALTPLPTAERDRVLRAVSAYLEPVDGPEEGNK